MGPRRVRRYGGGFPTWAGVQQTEADSGEAVAPEGSWREGEELICSSTGRADFR